MCLTKPESFNSEALRPQNARSFWANSRNDKFPLSMGFFRQEYWSGLPFPSPGDLLNPGIEPESPSLQADSLPSEPARKPEIHESESFSVVSDSLQPHGLYSPWSSPGQKTGVGSLSLLQGIFPAQGSNPGLPHCRWILYLLSHKCWVHIYW